MAGSDSPRQRWLLTIRGVVQGVGFRPCVHRLARGLGLAGQVNNFTGGVHLELEGPVQALEAFVRRLPSEKPPICMIEGLEREVIEPRGQTDFVIVASQQSEGPIYVSPDVALCEDCRRELLDPGDRRYMYPFINCTNCGPRFTIIRELPYDRPKTTMARFDMCPVCRREYEDISDRRYHAQPVSCWDCGPTLQLLSPSGHLLGEGLDAVGQARELLARGAIVAVKGLGGFHLACDAASEATVRELRRRKQRWAKPLAVMAPSLEAIEYFAELDEASRELLEGPRAPIVLLPKRVPERLAPSVAPDSSDYGVMVPYTPLHLLLFGTQGSPFLALVMTSGNLSEEPLCTDNAEAFDRLGGLADAFLLHDRDILAGCDDSVLRATAAGAIMMRRSRGYVPLPVRLPEPVRPLLGVGGHLKNTFCLAKGDLAYPSQHVGDLDNAETLAYWQRSLARLEELCRVKPGAVACDLHPDYPSTRLAERLAEEKGLSLVRVQHHHAHLAACLADNCDTGPAVGLLCDGTGYGPDGTAWGCEVLVGDLVAYRRVGHLRYVGLPGGDQAVAEPWRVALAWLADCFGGDISAWPPAARAMAEAIGMERAEAILLMLRRGVNCPYASSAGRLFDAVAALLGLRLKVDYEAQAAMQLESLAARAWDHGDAGAAKGGPKAPQTAREYAFDVLSQPLLGTFGEPCDHLPSTPETLILDPRPVLRQIVEDLEAGVPEGTVAVRFHRAFIEALALVAEEACGATGLKKVALSGGTFQNRLLLEGLVQRLRGKGLEPLWHRELSPNDSALAVGQVVVAGARLKRERLRDTAEAAQERK